jgi:hypothetical protein
VSAALALLPPQDEALVLTFGRTPRLVADGLAPALALGVPAALAGLTPDGPTAPDQVLPMLAEHLRDRADVVLLTDGQVPQIDAAGWRDTLAARRAALTLIAPSNARLAALVDATHARALVAGSPAAWAALLSDAVLGARVGALHTAPLAWRAPHLAGGRAGTAQAWTQTWLAPGAEAVAVGPADQPLAAVAQRGLGRAAALAMADPQPAGAALLAHLLTDVTAPPGDGRFTPHLARTADGWDLTIDAHEPAGFLDDADLSVEILTPEHPPQTVRLAQVGPGLYRATLGAARDPAALVVRGGRPGAARLVARIALPVLGPRDAPALSAPHSLPAAATRLAPGEQRPWLIRRTYDGTLLCLAGALGALVAALTIRGWPRRTLI